MDTNIIREFMYLSKDLSFSKTAARCGISLSVLSRHISALEAEVGFKLLTRHGKAVSLTPYGEVFAEKAREIIEVYDSAVEEARNYDGGFTDVLSVSYTAPLAHSFMHDAYAMHLERNPDVRLELLSSWEDRVLTMLNQGRAHIALVMCFVDPDPLTYQTQKLFDDHYVIVVPQSSHLYALDSVTLDDLAGEKLLIPGNGDSPIQHRHITDALVGHPDILYAEALNNKLDGVALTNAGFGLALLPSHQVGDADLHGSRIVDVDEEALRFQARAVWVKSRMMPKIGDFLEILGETTARMDSDTLRNKG